MIVALFVDCNITEPDSDAANVVPLDFVDTILLAKDARALRTYINEITPGIDMKVDVEFYDGHVEEGIDLPIGLNFFWPDAGV